MSQVRFTATLGLVGLLAITGGALAAKPEEKKAAATQTMPADRAHAAIEGRSGSTLTGTAEFTVHGGMLMITVNVKGAPPGIHAVHIHEKGDCSAPDAMSAGGHFNPGGHQHGAPDAKEHHAGDLGNMTVAGDGIAAQPGHTRGRISRPFGTAANRPLRQDRDRQRPGRKGPRAARHRSWSL